MAANDLEYNSGFQIYNSDGTPFHDLVLHKCTYETVVMSLGDKISGILYYKDNALDVKMTEYIIYKDVKYTLVNPPTILKEGLVSDNSELKGMTKYSFTFYHPMYVLNNFSFNDVAVSSDQNKYLSQNKTFSWIGNLNDYVAKINKNLQGTEWIVKVGNNVTQEEKTKLSDVLSFDKNTIAEALKRGYETWEVPYVVDSIQKGEYFYINDKNQKIDYYDEDKHFVVQYGLPTTEITVKDDNDFETPYVFKMGQGVGLKNNSRNPQNNKIITRIAGYGSEDNIPYGYPQIIYYGGNVQYPLYYGIVGGQRVQLIKHPFTRNHLMPSVYSQAVYNKVNPKLSDGSNNPNYNPNIELVDYYDADSTYANPIKSGSPSYEIHEFGDIKPELGEKTIISAVPVSQQETQSDYKQKSDFLQDILNRISATEIEDEKVCLKTLYDKVDAGLSYYAQKGEEGGREYWYRISVTSDDYYQYVSYESGNYNFTATVLKNDSSAPTPEWDDTMDDDGKYLQSYFKITLPILSFDLYACAAITQEMKINMRSGACIGCTFPVEVDWDDYKRNFYNSDGEFAPDGEQRDYTKYPDSSSGQITVMVKKELDTFGTLMPNQYQQPTTGDKFVILGISLPESYITNAEQRLDADMKQYMRDNNVYYYEYPLKFDEHFLISNENILSQMKPNVVVRFEYAGVTHALYIKQMSVKYNESPLPKYDITLTDDIEIVLNQIGQVTDEVSKLRLGFGTGGFGTVGAEYIRKDIDDTARGTIRMIKGMQVGERFVTGLLGEGGVFRKDSDGTTYLETDKLYVRMKAYFDTVEVKHYLHTGGNRIASQASGIVCSRVEMIDAYNNLTMDVADAVLFRCFFKANDGDKTIRNDFMIGDLAFCRETNVDVSSVNLHGYWRLVVGRNGNDSLTDNKEAWIDLSNRASETLTIDGRDYTCNGYQNGSDAPIAQDDIIQLGNIADKDRQGAIVEYVGGEDAPSYQIFQGIGEDLPYPYTLEDKNYIGLGYSSQTGHAYMNVYGDVFIGAKPDAVTGESPTYIKYVQEDSETGEPKLSIKAEVEFIHSDGQGGSTSTTMDDFVKSVEDSFKDIQDQIDGKIDTWYYEGVPTLLNLPASEWNTDELKKEHIGDLYYDKENGDAYRFIFDTSVEPNEYKWIQLHDDAISEALRLAADAKDTADNKRRVFLTQPTPPYDEGDIWVNATYPANSDSTDAAQNRYYNDVLCAKKAVPRTEDGKEITTFSITDWELASKYTDDTKFDGYINQILNGTGASGDSAIVASAIKAIKNALNEGTVIDGGLVLTSLISLRSNNKTWAGISGQYDATAKGYGIAAWYGGRYADWEVYLDTLTQEQRQSATITDAYAKSLFRFDGSGYLAGGNITWDSQGRVAIKDITTLVGGNNTDILNALATFNSAFRFTTAQGSSTILNINPQYAFSHLEIYDVNGNHAVATTDYVNENFVTKDFFESLFELYNDNTYINTNTDISKYDKSKLNIKAMFGFWTEKYISALGKGDDGGGSVISGYLSQLLDVNVTSPQVGQALVYNGTKWVNQTIQTGGIDFNDMKLLTVKVGTNTKVAEYKGETAKTLTFDAVANSGITVSGDTGGTITIGYTLPKATKDILGGVKVGNTLSISDGVLNLPTISNLVAGTYRSVTVDAYGRVTAGTNPTTLAGYGITDAKIANGVITLGTNTITPLTDAKIKSDYEWWGQKMSTNGKVNGNVFINMSTFDLSKTDNGVATTIWPGFRVRDNANRNSFQAINAVSANGTNAGRISVYNYNTSGTSVADKGMTISVAKNGDCSISLEGTTTIGGNLTLAATSGTYIKIGGLYLVYDQSNNAIKVSASPTGNTTANFYATGAVSALGISDSGGTSTFNESQMWTALGTNSTSKLISSAYLGNVTKTLTIKNGNGVIIGTYNGTETKEITVPGLSGDYLPLTLPAGGKTVTIPSVANNLNSVVTFKNAGSDYSLIRFEGKDAGGLGFIGIGKTGDNVHLSYVTADANGGYTEGESQWHSILHTGNFRAGDNVSISWNATEKKYVVSSTITALDWSKITTGKPTTLAGYGIATKWWGQTHKTVSGEEVVEGDMTGVGSITMSENVYMAYNKAIIMKTSENKSEAVISLSPIDTTKTGHDNDVVLLGYETAKHGIKTRIFGGDIGFYYGTGRGHGMTLTSEGKLGIGTTAPETTLDVYGSEYVKDELKIGNERLFWSNRDGNDVFMCYSWNASANSYRDILIGTFTDAIQWGGLYFNSSSWNWGVGTATPSTKLDVNGSIKANRFYLRKPNSDDTGAIYLVWDNDSSNPGVHLVGAGLWTDSFVSALGKGDDGGASTFDETAMWNALGIAGASHKIHNDHLSLGTLTINGETWNPATSGNKTINITSADGYITPIASGNVNTAKSDGNVWFKKAYVSSDSTPNNGVVIEYGNSTSWVGQLYLGDNATQGLYWNGWYNGVRGTWKKIAFADDYLPLTGGTLSKSGRDILYINQEGSDAVGSYITFKVNGTDAGYFGYNTGSGFFIQHVYNGVNKTLKIGTDGSLSFAGNTVLDSGNSSVTLSGETLTVKINGTSKSLTNTWRGIKDELTSTSTTDSLSANQGRLLKNDVTTLQGYFSNGVAKSAAKLSDTAAYTAWGRTFFTNGKPATVSGALESVTNITMSGDIYMSTDKYIYTKISGSNRGLLGTWSGYTAAWLGYYTAHDSGYDMLIYGKNIKLYYGTSATQGFVLNNNGNVGIGTTSPSAKLDVQGSVKIGGATLTWDSDNQALKIDKGFYSDSFVSALGANASGGSGSGIDANWLKTNDVQIQRLGIGVAPSSSHQLKVQGASNFTGDVAINSALTVSNSVTVNGSISSQYGSISCANDITAGGRGLIQKRLTVGDTSVNTSYNLYVNGSSLFNGNVGIGGYDNACKLYVSGKVKFSKMSISNTTNPDSTTYTSLGVSDSLSVSVTGSANINKAWVVSSDMRLKDVCQHFDIDITSVAKAPLFTYRLKNSGSQLMVGTSAQYWMDKIPETVTLGYDGYYGLDYNGVLTASVISVARKVVDHELRVKQLEERIAELENEINELKAA